MANNRMFLVHKPTKLGVMLGKRMGWGWYNAPDQKEMERFFEYLQSNSDKQDDFILAMEDCEDSDCFDGWQYTYEKVDGFMVFEWIENIPT